MSRHRYVGKHRAERRRLSVRGRVGTCAVLIASCGLAGATWPAEVSADSPVRTGWWNQASSGGQSAPQPTTPAGGLHLAVASSQIAAFGAVLYRLPADARATLTLGVADLTATPVLNPTSPSTAPQVGVQACPTKDLGWKAGDDQPWDAAPGYDCTHSVPGTLSHDQKSVVFLVDGSMDASPGQLSLAIVPTLTNGIPGAGTDAPVGTTQPYSLDTVKPDAASLAITDGGVPSNVETKPSGATPASATTDTTAGSVDTSRDEPAVPPPLPDTGASAVAPLTDTAPVVAPPTTAAPGPALTADGASPTRRARDAALAMLLLIAVALAAMSNGQTQRAPRLLGGSARRSTAPPAAIHGTGGIGRFSRPRTGPARPLI